MCNAMLDCWKRRRLGIQVDLGPIIGNAYTFQRPEAKQIKMSHILEIGGHRAEVGCRVNPRHLFIGALCTRFAGEALPVSRRPAATEPKPPTLCLDRGKSSHCITEPLEYCCLPLLYGSTLHCLKTLRSAHSSANSVPSFVAACDRP